MKNLDCLNVLIVGVGGQGTLLASKFLGAAAALCNKDVKVNIKEILTKIVEVEADCLSDAFKIVEDKYNNEEIVLDWSDLNSVEYFKA